MKARDGRESLDARTEAQERWRVWLAVVERFAREHGIENAVAVTVYEGLPLGRWLVSMRARCRSGEISDWLRQRLERIPGWTTELRGDAGREHRTRLVIRTHLDALHRHIACGRPLAELEKAGRGQSLYNIRMYFYKLRKKGLLPRDVERELGAVPGWTWPVDYAARDRHGLRVLRKHIAAGGVAVCPPSVRVGEFPLGAWVTSCRTRRAAGKLPQWLHDALDRVRGWTWRPGKPMLRDPEYLDRLRKFLKRKPVVALAREPVQGGVNLRNWVDRQRRLYRGGRLPRSMIAALEGLPGWYWDQNRRHLRLAALDRALRSLSGARPHAATLGGDRGGKRKPDTGIPPLEARFVDLIASHFAATGRADFPKRIRPGGVQLRYIATLFRTQHAEGTISPAVARALKAVPGWSWDPVADRFKHNLALVRRYIAEHGLDALTGGVVYEGVRLGKWMADQRLQMRRGRLAKRWHREFESLPGWRAFKGRTGMGARARNQATRSHLEALRRHYSGERLLAEDGPRTAAARSVRYIRAYFQELGARGQLTDDVKRELQAIPGFEPHLRTSGTEKRLGILRKLAEKRGLPYITWGRYVDGLHIGGWVDTCCRSHRAGTLNPWLASQLEAIPGWVWKPSPEEVRHRKFQLLIEFLEDRELADLPHHPNRSGVDLHQFTAGLRRAYRAGTLDDDAIRIAEHLPGWSWEPRTDRSPGWPRRRRRRPIGDH